MYTEFTVSNHDVKLYCRRYGNGVPLLLIHGSCVDNSFFEKGAELLSHSFTVCTYDRRGTGRSTVPVDGDFSVPAQAADALAVIKSIGEPAYVAAHSAGCAVGLELSSYHAGSARRLLLLEPMLISCITDEYPCVAEIRKLEELLEQKKYTSALGRFLGLIGAKDERGNELTQDKIEGTLKNGRLFMEHEYRDFMYYRPNFDGLKWQNITVGLSEGSRDTQFEVVASSLTASLGCKILYLPGRHNFPCDLPYEFACMMKGFFTMN